MKKRVVVALGHRALGTTLPEQKEAVKKTAKVIADMIAAGYQAAITHSNAPQVGMIHTAMNEFGKAHQDYTAAPMSVCSAMSQGYIGYDLQNAIREALLNEGVYRTVSTILTQVVVDPYDEAFYTPTKVLGRYMNAEEANLERKKGNYVVEEPGKGFRRIVSAPNPGKIVEIAPVVEIFHSPAHPYTQGLIDAVPRLDKKQGMLYSIKGSVPSFAALPKGCAFGPRCPYYSAQCETPPPCVQLKPDWTVRCWRAAVEKEQ